MTDETKTDVWSSLKDIFRFASAVLSLGLVLIGIINLVSHRSQDTLVCFVLYLAVRVAQHEATHD